MIELIEDPENNGMRFGEKIDKDLLAGKIGEALNILTPRERRILELRFGFNGEEDKSLEEIGKLMGVTRERVRQIGKGALEKLKTSSQGGELREFLGVE